ncbi:unnamed protein product [Owenia fusiformis]|uniref:Uncharacterized protein n=1 Tax=Owenia fusiformis TaxID=6347 RepID=A0A8J1XR83_OWEFU|nr:unnamed protein product [Owenia fusiformis]
MAAQFTEQRFQQGLKLTISVFACLMLIYALYGIGPWKNNTLQPWIRNQYLPISSAERNVQIPSVTCDVMMNIVTSFPDSLANETYLASRGYAHENTTKRRNRHIEYLYTLKKNTEHPCVEQIHLLVESGSVKESIKSQTLIPINLSRVDKLLTFSEIRERPTMKMLAEYASENLIGKVVAFQNADIIVGEGFENVKMQYLKDMRIFYSLSRQGAMDATSCQLRNYCDNYNGAHDTYMLYLGTPFTPKAMSLLDFPMNAHGAENVLIDHGKAGVSTRKPLSVNKRQRSMDSLFADCAMKTSSADIMCLRSYMVTPSGPQKLYDGPQKLISGPQELYGGTQKLYREPQWPQEAIQQPPEATRWPPESI